MDSSAYQIRGRERTSALRPLGLWKAKRGDSGLEEEGESLESLSSESDVSLYSATLIDGRVDSPNSVVSSNGASDAHVSCDVESISCKLFA